MLLHLIQKTKGYCCEASTVMPFVCLKFDVAKLGQRSSEYKKKHSTAHFHNHL